MSIRFTVKASRGLVALTMAAGLALGMVGCGSGDEDKKPDASTSAPEGGGSKPSAQKGQAEQILAELKGPNSLLLRITSVKRDSGGFVTVNGTMKNDGSGDAIIPSNLSGNETEVIRNGSSLGGATLVDSKGKKRYYVLRDTDGRPLTTTGLPSLKPGEAIPVFMQFPAPPTSTTEVDFQLPGFATATLELSE